MARLRELGLEDLDPADRDVLERDLSWFRVTAHSPGAARAFRHVAHFIRHDSKLDPRLRELAILQVSLFTGSTYEWSHHLKIGFEFGVTPSDVEAILAMAAGEPYNLDDTSRLVLQGAREVALNGAMEADTVASLKELLGERELVDVVIISSFYVAVARAIATFDIDVEPEYEPYLSQFPLPST